MIHSTSQRLNPLNFKHPSFPTFLLRTHQATTLIGYMFVHSVMQLVLKRTSEVVNLMLRALLVGLSRDARESAARSACSSAQSLFLPPMPPTLRPVITVLGQELAPGPVLPWVAWNEVLVVRNAVRQYLLFFGRNENLPVSTVNVCPITWRSFSRLFFLMKRDHSQSSAYFYINRIMYEFLHSCV